MIWQDQPPCRLMKTALRKAKINAVGVVGLVENMVSGMLKG